MNTLMTRRSNPSLRKGAKNEFESRHTLQPVPQRAVSQTEDSAHPSLWLVAHTSPRMSSSSGAFQKPLPSQNFT